MFKSKEIINIKNDRKLQLLLNGVKLTYNAKDEIYRIYNNKKFIGIGIIQNNLLKRDIILWWNLPNGKPFLVDLIYFKRKNKVEIKFFSNLIIT